MKKKGFTLIELLAVIIILAVIALIATPIVLNVVENARERARKESINGYANATNAAIYDYQFANNGTYPNVDKTWADSNAKTNGDKVECEEVYFSKVFGIVLHQCSVGTNTKKYCHASGKTYEDCEDSGYKEAYNSLTDLSSALLIQYQESNTVGLLKDTESNSYYYKGTNEEVNNNYVWFAGHLWRVISINEDNSLTMITQQPLTSISSASTVWTTQVQYKASYINHWLNSETDGVFYKSLEQADKDKIQESTFNIGAAPNISQINTTLKVGLLDKTQYTKAGGQNSFLNINDVFILGNRINTTSSNIVGVSANGSIIGRTAGNRNGIRPVIKISNLTFTEGDGTLSNPYRENSTTTSTTNIKVGEYISVPTSGNDCGEDKRCLFRVVSKDNNSIKVILNGLLPNNSQFGTTATYTSGSAIDNIVTTFANTIDSKYRYTGTDKIFNIGTYSTGKSYTTVQNAEYTGTVGLPVVGEMFSGNDIDVTFSAKTFVNVNTIENSFFSNCFWTMNANGSTTSHVEYIPNSGSLSSTSGDPTSSYGVRPVLFLNNNLTFTSGDGTAEHPFILGK